MALFKNYNNAARGRSSDSRPYSLSIKSRGCHPNLETGYDR